LLAHALVLAQQLERQAHQVVEVHALVGGQALFIVRHDARDGALLVAVGLRHGLGRVEAHVLPQADGPLPLPRGGRVGAAAGVLDDAGHVVAVENRELGLQAQRRAVLAQHAHAQRVEGADQHALGAFADQRLGPLAHFGGGLVGEGDRRDLLGLESRLDQPAYLVRDHPRLARTGARQHQAGTMQVVHGFLLGGVQAVGHEKRIDSKGENARGRPWQGLR
jgi:hypothetical protein